MAAASSPATTRPSVRPKPDVIETARLLLRPLSLEDAPFILRLVNEPSWLRYIGDKQVHDLAGAERYLREGPLEMAKAPGIGMNLVTRRADGEALGICGLLQREELPDPDLGFALLPEHWGQGFAHEAARACLDHAARVDGLRRVLAIATPDNRASAGLLEKLGFLEESGYAVESGQEILICYAIDLEPR